MTTYYLDEADGNDFNSGLTEADAWKTIGKVNGFPFADGDPILFKAGNIWFNEQLNPHIENMICSRYGIGANPLIDGSEEEFCILIIGPRGITIDGIDCRRAQKNCIKVTGLSYDLEIKNLDLAYADSQGFLQSGEASNTIIRNVRSHHNGTTKNHHGFYMGSIADNGRFLIENSDASFNAGYGFHIWNSGGGDLEKTSGRGNGSGTYVVGKLVGNSTLRIVI